MGMNEHERTQVGSNEIRVGSSTAQVGSNESQVGFYENKLVSIEAQLVTARGRRAVLAWGRLITILAALATGYLAWEHQDAWWLVAVVGAVAAFGRDCLPACRQLPSRR